MKNKIIIPLSIMLIALASCGSDQPEAEEVTEVTYTLDTENSVLNWHGEENAEHAHDGTLSFSSGSLTMVEDEVKEGEFIIDIASISPTTEGLPDNKKASLKEHLMDTTILFFDKYPNVTVNTGAYKDGKLYTVINVRGVEITKEIPVEIKQNGDELTMEGDFSVDFADAKMPYLTEPKESTGKPGVKSVIDFSLELRLTK